MLRKCLGHPGPELTPLSPEMGHEPFFFAFSAHLRGLNEYRNVSESGISFVMQKTGKAAE